MMDRVVDQRMPRFYWVDHAVLTEHARHIKPSGVAIYSVLCMHADRNQEARISLDTICAETGIETREAVLKYLGLLEERRLIAIVRRPHRGGNIYRLLDVVGEPGTPRPNKPSARIIGELPVKKAVDKSNGTVGNSDSSPQELSVLPTSVVGNSDSSAAGSVGISDSKAPELSEIPTRTRQETRHSRLLDELDDDDEGDPRAREQSSSSSQPSSRSDLENHYGVRAVEDALDVADKAGKTGSLRYATGVLRNWEREGTMPGHRKKHRRINPYDW